MFCRRKIESVLGLIAAFTLVVPVAAVAMAPPPAEGAEAGRPAPAPRPAIWLLADEDTRIYLFGTIHMLPPGLHWRSPAFETVVREADELVLEVAEELDPAEYPSLARLIMIDDPVPLLDRVSPERRDALREMVESLGMTVRTFDRVQTWAAAMTIAVASLTQALAGPDGSPEDITGVEDELRVDFNRSQRPISGVEDGPQQMGFLSGLTPGTQREMLEEMVDAYREGDPDIMAPSEDGWLRGDVADIATEMEAMPEELFDVLVTRRNTMWTGWLIARLERPGTVLFAVGAGHLAGRDSVQSMLAGRGFSVSRVQ
jgi:uncharacterized protein